VRESDVAGLHGLGPKTLRILQHELAAHHLSFARGK
jgi:hypothetical protein